MRELQISGRSNKENRAILPETLNADRSRQNKLDRQIYTTTDKAGKNFYEDAETVNRTVSFRQKSQERMISLVTLTSSEESSDDFDRPAASSGYLTRGSRNLNAL